MSDIAQVELRSGRVLSPWLMVEAMAQVGGLIMLDPAAGWSLTKILHRR